MDEGDSFLAAHYSDQGSSRVACETYETDRKRIDRYHYQPSFAGMTFKQATQL